MQQSLPISFKSIASGSVGGRSYTPYTSVFESYLMENTHVMSSKIFYIYIICDRMISLFHDNSKFWFCRCCIFVMFANNSLTSSACLLQI